MSSEVSLATGRKQVAVIVSHHNLLYSTVLSLNSNTIIVVENPTSRRWRQLDGDEVS